MTVSEWTLARGLLIYAATDFCSPISKRVFAVSVDHQYLLFGFILFFMYNLRTRRATSDRGGRIINLAVVRVQKRL